MLTNMELLNLSTVNVPLSSEVGRDSNIAEYFQASLELSALKNFTDTLSFSTMTFTIHLGVINVVACSLIGLSTMISLYVFNLLMKRPINPFGTFSSTINEQKVVLKETSSNHNNNHLQTAQSHSQVKSQTNGSSSSVKNAVSIESPTNFQNRWMKRILAFAVGGLLGDVFLHLLPEASGSLANLKYSIYEIQHYLGLWILVGMILFVIFESVFTQLFEEESENGDSETSNVKATGYMNLVANAFDNFSHGMSVGASFLVSYKMGCLTTLAIIIHEIPHEIADHAILIRSGFSIWEAFKAQMSICLVTIFGALVVLLCDSSNETINQTLWILPLTAGGFIYIALSNLLPEVLDFGDIDFIQERKYTKMSIKVIKCKAISERILFMFAGVFVMASVNVLELF